MRRVRLMSIVGVVALLIAWSSSVSAEIIDKIVAVVNDDPITQSELDAQFFPIYQQYLQTYEGQELAEKLDEARQAVLNQLVEERLIYHEAESKGLTISEEEVDDRIADVQNRVGSPQEFWEKIHEQGLTMKQLRERFRKQIAVQKMLQYMVYNNIIISPSEVAAYYQENLEEFSEEERAKVSTIMLRKDEEKEALAETRVRLEDLVAQISSGTPFADVAREFSEESHAEQGGAVGFVTKGDMIAVIDEAIFACEVGHVTDIIETDVGFHIFFVEVKQEAASTPLEDVREYIQEKIFRDRIEAKKNAWIEELKENAYISFK